MSISSLLSSALRAPQAALPVSPPVNATSVSLPKTKDATTLLESDTPKPATKTGILLTSATTAAIANATLPEIQNSVVTKADTSAEEPGTITPQTTPAPTPQGITVQTGAYNSVAGTSNTTIRGSGLNIAS